MAREIRRIIIHCSASSFGCADVIRSWHVDGNGWDDIGYHYVINNGKPHSNEPYQEEWDGKVETGREHDVVGAHAAGHNHDSLGICLIGLGDGKFTPAQIAALEQTVEWLQGTYNIPNSGVIGHRDVNPHKECPGFNVNHWMLTKAA